MSTIEDFWKIDDLIKSKWGKKFYNFIDFCGITPIRPPKHYGYFCTPKNALTFARTGGNGVHFGLVKGIETPNHLEPVVMTVPMAENHNVIIAENLAEFFSLGYYNGWDALEEIVYNQERAIHYYATPEQNLSEKQTRFLKIIRSELPIQPQMLNKERLEDLQKKYFHQLEVATLDEWMEENWD